LRHGLHRNQLYMWRRELRSGGLSTASVAVRRHGTDLPG